MRALHKIDVELKGKSFLELRYRSTADAIIAASFPAGQSQFCADLNQ